MKPAGTEVTEIFIGDTRLRVISDCSDDISAIVQAEIAVITRYTATGRWPHTAVTLFVLENLAPLVTQLGALHGLGPSQAALLPQRPMVNLYDLKNPTQCFVFVNRAVMRQEGVWDDALAVTGMLAHEHAHPRAECSVITAARAAQLDIRAPAGLMTQVTQLVEMLSVGAIVELLTNQVCVADGFADALLHLDQHTITRAGAVMGQRQELRRRLREAAPGQQMSPGDEALLLQLADARHVLPFALETAPFFRAGQTKHGTQLLHAVKTNLLSQLEPDSADMFFALHTLYLEPEPDWTGVQLRPWLGRVVARLNASFSGHDNAGALHFAVAA